jgi:aminoglycoside phosphotransferase (APT) family kinase protein
MTATASTPQMIRQLDQFLLAHSLRRPGEASTYTSLTGGVSSDIWRVDLPGRSICVKRALPALRVTAQWEAPVQRNANEWAWLCFAVRHEPRAVPQPLAHDPEAGLFAMSYLSPEEFPNWKQALLNGQADPQTATAVGHIIVGLHNASAGQPAIERRFDTLEIFRALRLDPYFQTLADHHSSLSSRLHEISARTAKMKIALVHGDVSPKNILIGPQGPVILDAECAWYGDPAFDLAFCLTHLLLKSLARPSHLDAYFKCFDALTTSYLSGIQFEPREALESRAASLLPALLLARIDGKSPVEYLAGRPTTQQWVRDFTYPLIAADPHGLAVIAEHWRRQLTESDLASIAS